MPAGLKPCGGSQWWCLSREALEHLSGYLDNNPKVVRFFKNVPLPDETIFQTLLHNSPFRHAIISDDLHYIDRDRPNPTSPRVLDETDIDRLRGSPKLFARKFDMARGAGVLDLIDRDFLSSARIN